MQKVKDRQDILEEQGEKPTVLIMETYKVLVMRTVWYWCKDYMENNKYAVRSTDRYLFYCKGVW